VARSFADDSLDFRDLPQGEAAAAVLAALRSGAPIDDWDVDRLLPKAARKLARTHFTPVAVARRAAAFLAPRPDVTVLDVGAGAGKALLTMALASGARCVGIEEAPELAAVARALVRVHRIERVRVVCGDALASDWSAFGGIYLYNPFAEAVHAAPRDGDERRRRGARAAEKLAALPAGARVAVFCGLGGVALRGLAWVGEERFLGGVLEFWQKE
jgi:SAM-dependent methyltransferase